MSTVFRTLAAAGIACALLPAGIAPAQGAAEAPARKPRVAVTVSKETTRITAPLRADGYPDYLAALNQIASEGVTPENNAAVPLWRAFGPKEIDENTRERFFKMLGIPPLPEKGDYLIPLEQYAKAHPDLVPKPAGPASEEDEEHEAPDAAQRAWDALDEAMGRPWTAKELPLIAGWLEANEKPIRLIVEASNRPRRYDPLVGSEEDTMVIAVLLPDIQQIRSAARVLKARAMLRLGEGKVDEAWADMLAVHRLGRLAGDGLTLIDCLVGIAVEGIACHGDNVLLAHGKLTAAQALKMRDDLRRLPPTCSMAGRIDVGERFMYMDAVCTIARKGVAGMQSLVSMTGGGGPSKDLAESLMNLAARLTIDWDVPLRMGNQWYDRMAEAGRKPTRAERKTAFSEIDDDIKELTAKARDPKALAAGLLVNPRKLASERMGQVFVALLLPAIGAVFEAEDRGAMTRELAELGFALAAYRADHGKYPAALAGLAPKYVDKLPQDIYSGGPLVYRAEGEGFLLYSVGRNEKDDGGRGHADRTDDAPGSHDWDDLAVRVPMK